MKRHAKKYSGIRNPERLPNKYEKNTRNNFSIFYLCPISDTSLPKLHLPTFLFAPPSHEKNQNKGIQGIIRLITGNPLLLHCAPLLLLEIPPHLSPHCSALRATITTSAIATKDLPKHLTYFPSRTTDSPKRKKSANTSLVRQNVFF